MQIDWDQEPEAAIFTETQLAEIINDIFDEVADLALRFDSAVQEQILNWVLYNRRIALADDGVMN